MKVAEPKPDKRALFDAALKDSEGEPTAAATTPRKKAAPKKAQPAEAPADAALRPRPRRFRPSPRRPTAAG